MVGHFEPLETGRLCLVPITDEVARAIMTGDVAVLDPAPGWPQAGTVAGVTLALEHGHPPGWIVRREGQVIGDCGIRAPVDSAGSVEIGYGLADSFQGQGLGTEMVTAMSDWLLGQPAVSPVRARTLPSNAPSRRALEKAGFTLVETTDEACFYERRA